MEILVVTYLFFLIIQANQPSFHFINSNDKLLTTYCYNVTDAVTKPTHFSLSRNQMIGPSMELTLISKGDG